MQVENHVTEADAERLAKALRRLPAHDSSGLSLTGGLAIEYGIAQRGGESLRRPLHDIDLLCAGFDRIPKTLGRDLLCRHVHPGDPPGRVMLQCVDPEVAVRFDIFRVYGSELDRAEPVRITTRFETVDLRVVSLLDLIARAARLSWDLMEDKPVPPRYARDFLRMLRCITANEIEPVWGDHRKPHFPAAFAETAEILCREIPLRSHLLVEPVYSVDIREICPRCHETPEYRLADPGRILELLGYC